MRRLVELTLVALLAVLSVAYAEPVPAARRTDWKFAGVPGGIPNRTTICATFSPGATAAAINGAISACNNGVVRLNAGTYTAASLGGTIRINSSNVTVRGAGADQTILTGSAIMAMGTTSISASGRTITGATRGSKTFTVSSAAGFSVGSMIEIDRDDDPNLVVGPTENGKRNIAQVNVITAISGSTITVRNPLIYDFSTGAPKIKSLFSNVTRLSGVEDLKLDHAGFSGGYNFFIQNCDSCWIKGVESAMATGFHFILTGTANTELRDSYVHRGGSGPNNSGYNFYGNYLYGVNSSAKLENNIFNMNFPAIELNGSSSGFAVSYNYSYGSVAQNGSGLVTWTFDDGHAPFNIMNLYEGNIGEQWGADNYYGGSGYGTALRNYFTGHNPNYGVRGDAVWLDRLAYNYNVIGNVLGSTSQNPASYTGCNGPSIYRLGYPNLGNCSTTPWDNFTPPGGYPDPKVVGTLLRWGNFDYETNSTRFVATEVPAGVPTPPDQTIPNSYLYSAKPAWWSGPPWPPIGPDVTGGNGDTSGHVNKTPAQLCWETSNLKTTGKFNAAACYAGKPVIISPFSATAITSQTFSYRIAATNSPTAFGATGLPAGLTVNRTNGLISGVPTAAGAYNVRLSATNAKGIGTATLALTVNALAPPVITSALTASGPVGAPFTYAIRATNLPTSYRAVGLPAGLSLNTTTGVISGTPTTVGAFNVTISATNAKGTGSATLNLTITNSAVVLLGSTGVTSSVDSNALGRAEVFQATARATGSLRYLSVYLDATSTVTRVVVGIYSDVGGRPSALLRQAVISAPKAARWNKVAITPVAITSGRTYWLAILGTTSGAIRFRHGSSGCRAENSLQTNLAILPATWTSGPTWLSCPLSGFGTSG